MKGITPYQFELLQRVSDLQKLHGEPPDLDQVLELLSWMPSKPSVQFTIRAMIDKGLISKRPAELRRGRVRVTFAIEKLGRQALDPRVEEPDDDVEKLVESELTEPELPEVVEFSLREVLEG